MEMPTQSKAGDTPSNEIRSMTTPAQPWQEDIPRGGKTLPASRDIHH
jgi:hypothetical protein